MFSYNYYHDKEIDKLLLAHFCGVTLNNKNFKQFADEAGSNDDNQKAAQVSLAHIY